VSVPVIEPVPIACKLNVFGSILSTHIIKKNQAVNTVDKLLLPSSISYRKKFNQCSFMEEREYGVPVYTGYLLKSNK